MYHSKLANQWQVLSDPVLGERRFRFDPSGLPVEAQLADGRQLSFRHDGEGRITALESDDGYALRLDYPAKRQAAMIAYDAAGTTALQVDVGKQVFVRTEKPNNTSPKIAFPGNTSLTAEDAPRRTSDDVAKLEIVRDTDDRLRRVQLPGSDRTLEYDWAQDGSLTIGVAGQRPHFAIEAERITRTYRLDGASWTERVSPTRARLCAQGADQQPLLKVEVQTDARRRILNRSWCDGHDKVKYEEAFTRDEEDRLLNWRTRSVCDAGQHNGSAAGETVHTYGYGAGGVLTETRASGNRRVIQRRVLDESGRVTQLCAVGGATIHYDYDAAGRRVRRADAQGVTHYEYDVLGKLIGVARADGTTIRMAYDGLGRRIWIECDGVRCLEHRDARGRLWAVTDAQGRALHSFIWLEDRVLARIDGAVDEPLTEAFLCEGWGTLLGVLSQDSENNRGGAWRAERVTLPPYGVADQPARPTLYGHFADTETGLIHFGGRDFDPEVGLFLTPDPWHGGPDDPRRWARVSEVELAMMTELPKARTHPYALCQFDPLGAADRNGYSTDSHGLSILRSFLNLILAPTWGMPLTAASLFALLPLTLYVEILGFAWGWAPLHSFFRGSRFLAGSWRQGLFTFSFNGFIPGFFVANPRIFFGEFSLHKHRAVTIGNVVWISRQELGLLDRAQVLEVEDLSGQDAGHSHFNRDPTKRSIVAVESTEAGRRQIHSSYWSRGFGSEIAVHGAVQSFRDRAVGGSRRSTIHLAKVLPEDFPVADSQNASVAMKVREYLHEPGVDRVSDAELVELANFALKFKKKETGLQPGDPIEVRAKQPADTIAYFVVARNLPDKGFAQALLYESFPAHFNGPPVIKKDLTVRRLTDTRDAASDTWAVPGAPGANKKVLRKIKDLADPPKLRKGDAVRVEATSADAAITHPFGDPIHVNAKQNRFARLGRIQSTIVVDSPAPTVAAPVGAVRWELVVMNSKGPVRNGQIPDPAKPNELEVAGSGLNDNDFLWVKLAAGAPAYGRVVDVNGKKIEITYLGPALAPPAGAPAPISMQKLRDVKPAEEKGEVKTKTDDDKFGIEVDRLQWLKPGMIVHLNKGADHQIRMISAIAAAEIELAHYEVIGGGPYTVRRVETDSSFSKLSDVGRSSLRRFVKHTGGADPSAYGDYPGFVLNLEFDGTPFTVPGAPFDIVIEGADAMPLVSAFYVKSNAADFHDTFRARWQPVEIGGDKFWLLDEDLPITEGVGALDGKTVWRIDPEDRTLDRHLIVAPPYKLKVREFQHHGVERPLPGGRKVTAHPPEVQVPLDPYLHDTHKSALLEHEIHHAVQNNRYGPIMGALPFQGTLLTVAQLDNAGVEWLREPIGDDDKFNWAAAFSLGGLMQLLWKYILLSPSFFSKDARDAITSKNFDFWNRIFNPVWGNLIDRFPEIQRRPDDPDFEPGFDEDFGLAFVQFLAVLMDLRSWTPGLGFIFLMFPDSAQNLLEQQASRASGDLYSSILTANDKFNYKIDTRSFLPDLVPDSSAANLTTGLGDVVRLMLFAQFRLDRLLRFDHADRPSSPLRYRNSGGLMGNEDALTMEVTGPAGATVLLHPALYERILPPPAPPPARPPAITTRALIGPPSNAATVPFIEANPGDPFRLLVRALAPTPPRVNRSAGIYFIAAAEGEYRFIMPNGDPNGADTGTVAIKIESKVIYGEDPVTWATPKVAPSGVKITRWATENQELKIEDHKIAGYELRIDNPAAPAPPAPALPQLVTKRDGSSSWTLTIDKANHGGPHDVRVRIYRIFSKNDAANPGRNDPAFDLKFDAGEVPALNGVTSFLDNDIWIIVRDFEIEVKELPALAAATVKSNKSHEFDVAIPLQLDRPISIAPKPADPRAPRFPNAEKVGSATNTAAFPRGERWKVGPLDEVIEDPRVYEVKVTYGKTGHTNTVSFDLTVEPVIHLTDSSVPAKFEASEATDLIMDIKGGAAPYTVSAQNLPDDSQAVIAGNQVRVEVTEVPAAATDATITVRDQNGLEGRRKIRVVV